MLATAEQRDAFLRGSDEEPPGDVVDGKGVRTRPNGNGCDDCETLEIDRGNAFGRGLRPADPEQALTPIERDLARNDTERDLLERAQGSEIDHAQGRTSVLREDEERAQRIDHGRRGTAGQPNQGREGGGAQAQLWILHGDRAVLVKGDEEGDRKIANLSPPSGRGDQQAGRGVTSLGVVVRLGGSAAEEGARLFRGRQRGRARGRREAKAEWLSRPDGPARGRRETGPPGRGDQGGFGGSGAAGEGDRGHQRGQPEHGTLAASCRPRLDHEISPGTAGENHRRSVPIHPGPRSRGAKARAERAARAEQGDPQREEARMATIGRVVPSAGGVRRWVVVAEHREGAGVPVLAAARRG